MLFSGSTFVVALLGLFIVPTSIMRSLALGAILVGIVSVAAALTLLPAVLSAAGDRVDSLSSRSWVATSAGGHRRRQLLAPDHRGMRPPPALSLVLSAWA